MGRFGAVQLLKHQTSYKSLNRPEINSVVVVDGNAMSREERDTIWAKKGS